MRPFAVVILLASHFLVFNTVLGQKPPQYKKFPRDQITRITKGNVDKARQYWEGYLQDHPDDLESHYGLAICYAQQGNLHRAMEIARNGVEKGLPFGRFLAGPRDILKPLTSSAPFKSWAAEQDIELIHGPTLGSLTDSHVKFWVRTWHEVPVQVRVSQHTDMSDAVLGNARTEKQLDYTAVVDVVGLKPSTKYFYQLVVNGKTLTETYDFQTMPSAGKPAIFTIMFGGGAGYTPWNERMWNVIDSHRPLAYMALGDNVYIDTPEVQNTQKYCYYRRQSRQEYRDFVSSTAVFAIWDDHDFTVNDGEGGPKIETPPWKREVWRTFRNNFANPSYGGGEQQPGCWFSCKMADVDFFFMDGRYYRSHKDGSMLGAAQKQWLLNSLGNSRATFKVLCANVPMTPGMKGKSKDTWDGYSDEREEIFGFIEENKIEGVFIIAADRHRSDAHKIQRKHGYPFYEFQSSKLTNIHTHDVIKGSLFGYNKKCSFGLLTFDTTAADPQVTYNVINIDDATVHSITIKRSELSLD